MLRCHWIGTASLRASALHFSNIQVRVAVRCQTRHFASFQNCGFICPKNFHNSILFLMGELTQLHSNLGFYKDRSPGATRPGMMMIVHVNQILEFRILRQFFTHITNHVHFWTSELSSLEVTRFLTSTPGPCVWREIIIHPK